MASNDSKNELTPQHVVRLAAAISADNMAAIAEGYMDISDETIKNIDRDTRNAEAFNREIIKYWKNKNPENQAEALAALLCKASKECGYVDRSLVLEILEVSERQMYLATLPKVSEAEFLTLAENLRPWTERAMKIEVAPWIRDYVVDMQELFCELILEKIACRAFGNERTTIENYQVLFDQNTQVPNKILAKGDPGIGKTTLAKKIAWDWAKGNFRKFSIVLFLFLKSVHPNDSLEKVMMEQIPELEGLGITQGELESFIEHFGRQCLLICDGLDEHALGSNNDVLKVLLHKKYLNCNVFVTSRPHSTVEIKSNFDTIVSVEGFTRSEARKFAYCIVRDEKVVEQILDFNPTAGKQEVSLCKCPILLSFICILVRENALDLSATTLPTGEIYARMVQCLYKKFTIRRKIEFDEIEFTKVVGLVGKLAFETLCSHDPLFKRSRVESEVGKDAFDYGFLIGHEDLINDMKADILITFPHRSIREFFGAFFFVLQLIEGRSIRDIVIDIAGPESKRNRESPLLAFESGKLIFMTNPLFLHFCFWFLSDKCGEDYFSLENRQVACEMLHSYIYHKIHRQLGSRVIRETFPAIDFQRALRTQDDINTEHFEQILRRFHKIKYLVVGPDDSLEWILNHILPACNALNVVGEWEESMQCEFRKHLRANGNNINILLSEKAYRAGILTRLLLKAVQCDRQPVVYLFLNEGKTVDLSEILHEEIRQLHMIGTGLVKMNEVIATTEFVPSTFLAHLSITGRIIVRKNVMVAINKAVRKGKLSRLQSLCFTGADVTSGLKDLFKGETTLLNVTHLDFSACKCDNNYFQALDLASKNGLLPKLTSLVISDDKYSLIPGGKIHFDYSWVNLISLSVKDMTKSGFRQLSKAINQSRLTHLTKLCLSAKQNEKCDLSKIQPDKIPLLEYFCVQKCIESKEALEQLSHLLSRWSLRTLDISHSCITGNMSILMSQHFTSLENLILHDCELNGLDLIRLDRAIADGRLPKLEDLDLSQNLHLVYCFNGTISRWNSLKRLRIDYNPNQSSIVQKEFYRVLLVPISHRIPSIQELMITAEYLLGCTGRWEHLKRLDIVALTDDQLNSILRHLDEIAQMGDFPSLQTVCFLTDRKYERSLSTDKLRQTGVDICFVDPNLEKIMVNAGLT